MSKTVIIELDFTYTPNEEDVYVCLKELMKDRSLEWGRKPFDGIGIRSGIMTMNSGTCNVMSEGEYKTVEDVISDLNIMIVEAPIPTHIAMILANVVGELENE